MNNHTQINLDQHFEDFVTSEVAQGRYENASEVVQAGLRLLEEQASRLAALRAALIAGEESGPASAFDVEAFIASKQGQASLVK